MAKKRRPNHPDAPAPRRHHPPPGKPQKPGKPKSKGTGGGGGKPQQHQHQQASQSAPVIPFSKDDRILLVGEGDLSFAASLVRHHLCRHVTATVLEKSEAELLEKYPHAAKNMEAVLAGPPARAPKKQSEDGGEPEDDEDEDDQESEEEQATPPPGRPAPKPTTKIIYNIDATKPLPSSCARPPPTRIFFNFPHVGGKSTDVNRQVRHNQSLLVSFFAAALRALSPEPGSAVVVTLFEGEPYTLWNVRDLARHAGLQVQRSFAFAAAAYPGYAHARTLGVVRSRAGGGDGSGGGWKGEDRSARSYVFVRKGDDSAPVNGAPGKGRKRAREVSDDEDD